MKRHRSDTPHIIDPDVLDAMLEATAPLVPPSGVARACTGRRRRESPNSRYVTWRRGALAGILSLRAGPRSRTKNLPSPCKRSWAWNCVSIT